MGVQQVKTVKEWMDRQIQELRTRAKQSQRNVHPPESSSRPAQSKDKIPSTSETLVQPPCSSTENVDTNRCPTLQMSHPHDQSSHRETANHPPQLTSRTRKAIQNVLKKNLQEMGMIAQIHSEAQRSDSKHENVWESTARNTQNSEPESSQFFLSESERQCCTQSHGVVCIYRSSMATKRATGIDG